MSVQSKTELLLELEKYMRKGYKLSNILTINDPLEKLQFELELAKHKERTKIKENQKELLTQMEQMLSIIRRI